jgi:hypothetical protein
MEGNGIGDGCCMLFSDDNMRVVLKTNKKYKSDYINATYVSVSMLDRNGQCIEDFLDRTF